VLLHTFEGSATMAHENWRSLAVHGWPEMMGHGSIDETAKKKE
jgi:hypothetical protein